MFIEHRSDGDFVSVMNARELLGKEVVGARGWKIGKAMDLALDLKTWQIKAIVVSLHKNVAEELGMNRILRKTRIPIEASLVMGIGDIITLQVSKSQLKEMLLQKTGKKNEGPKPTPS